MPQLRRRAHNESMFRDVNERIEALAANQGREQIEIVCECATIGCSTPLQLSIAGYESARREPTTFIVARGHNDPDIEVVVEDRGGYLVVQKIGDAADEARQTAPRP
jgi:hypothetical protein